MAKIRKVRIFGIETEIAGTGGDGSQPAPNSVTSEEIENGSIKKEDLEQDIQDKLDVLDESNVITEEELNDDWQEAMNNAGLDVNPTQEDISDEDLSQDWNDAIEQAGQESE